MYDACLYDIQFFIFCDVCLWMNNLCYVDIYDVCDAKMDALYAL